MLRTVFSLLTLLFIGCDFNKYTNLPPVSEFWDVNRTLTSLPIGVEIKGDVIADGVVISSDSTGNFYRQIIIQQIGTDFTVAIQLNVYDIFAVWRLGMVVAVNFDGLALGVENGQLVCGILGVDDKIAPIASLGMAINYINFQGVYGEPTVLNRTIKNITDADVGKLIRLDNIYFINQGTPFSGSQTIAQIGNSSTITLYTSPYASFTRDIVPVGTMELTAFVTLNASAHTQLKCNNAPAPIMRQNYSWTQRTELPLLR